MKIPLTKVDQIIRETDVRCKGCKYPLSELDDEAGFEYCHRCREYFDDMALMDEMEDLF